jgi:cyclopropane-fatty-acyl-phospholipid synthase
MTTYPHLVGFLEELGVPSEPSDMSFSLSVSDGKDGRDGLEWASHGLGALFAQRSNAASPAFLRMVADVVRFGRSAPEVLDPASPFANSSFGDYLKAKRFSEAFVKNYVLPMCAAVWSVPAATVLAFPAPMLVRFWANHHLLDLTQRPVWRVVAGRSRAYVAAVTAALPDVRCGAGVERVVPAEGGGRTPARVFVAGGPAEGEPFDAVVLATHSDTALALIGGADGPAAAGPCAAAAAALAAIPYGANEVILHTDAAGGLMPARRAAWASWNCVSRGGGGATSAQPSSDTSAVCVTYWVNSLQRLPPGAPDTFVTLNPPPGCAPDPAKVGRKLTLHHPIFGPSTPAAQAAIAAANATEGATSRLYFAGAWAGYGFHEDGMRAAVAVASLLSAGSPPPWAPRIGRTPSPKLGLIDRAAIAAFDAFARRAVTVGRLSIILPTGAQLDYGQVGAADADLLPPGVPAWRGAPPRAATIRVLDPAFFRLVATRHDTGLGEAYMSGAWECADADFGGLLAVLAANAPGIEAARGALGPLNWVGDRLLAAAHAARSNTRAGSRSNIEAHYDAGNDMYKLFLDETMTYSSGIHAPSDADLPGGGVAGGFGDAGLAAAQHRKLDALLAAAGLRPGDHVLEIGCGWGSLAIRAVSAMPTLRWTGLTLSKQQLEEGIARVKATGLSDRISLLLCDYRDVAPPEGSTAFDAVLSCEMVEAVGHEHLPSYFAAIGRLLRPGGRAVLQAISVPDGRYAAYTASSDFIRAHIFPGGHLVSMGALAEAANAVSSGLTVSAVRDVGPDYAQTLRAWRAAWERDARAVLALGYPPSWWRKWRFYFAYCEAAFDARYIHDYQVVFVKGSGKGENGVSNGVAGGPGRSVPDVPLPAATTSRSLPLPAALLLGAACFWAGHALGSAPGAWTWPAALLVAGCVLAAVVAGRPGGGAGASLATTPATGAAAPARPSSAQASAMAAAAVASTTGDLVTDHEHEE